MKEDGDYSGSHAEQYRQHHALGRRRHHGPRFDDDPARTDTVGRG
jgi:hypothetical protein